jgi:hypothetical protein
MISRGKLGRALTLSLGLTLCGIAASASPPGQAAPVINGISPWVVTPGGEITISGDHFAIDPPSSGCGNPASAPQVAFLDPANPSNQLAGVTVASDSGHCGNQTLKVNVPPAVTGGARVVVTNTSGGQNVTSNNNRQITIQPTASINPSAGGVGTQVSVNGSNLHPPTTVPGSQLSVSFPGRSQSLGSWGNTFSFNPGHASGGGSLTLTVATDASDVSGSQQTINVPAGSFTFLPPTLNGGSLPPSQVGGRVSLPGSNLGSSGTVTFSGNVPGQSVNWSNGQVTVTVPSRAQPGTISLNVSTDGYGPVTDFNNGPPTIQLNPLITSMSPGSGSEGTTVRVNGWNLGGGGTISVGAANEPISSWADTQVLFSLTADADTGAVVLTRSDGQSAQAGTITLTPHLNRLDPGGSVIPGATVVAAGASLGAATGTLQLGGQTITPQLWSRESVVFTVPSLKPGSYRLVAVNAAGQSSNPLTLTVAAPPSNAPTSDHPAVASSPFFDNNHQFHKPPKPA